MDKEIIAEYLKTADDKLDSAKILLEHKKHDDAVSRAYYAVFHCAQALLLSIGVKAESHSGVRHMFGLHFIKEGKFDKKYAKYLKNLKEDREAGDYGILTLLEPEDAQDAIREAEEFVAETKRYIRKNQSP